MITNRSFFFSIICGRIREGPVIVPKLFLGIVFPVIRVLVLARNRRARALEETQKRETKGKRTTRENEMRREEKRAATCVSWKVNSASTSWTEHSDWTNDLRCLGVGGLVFVCVLVNS